MSLSAQVYPQDQTKNMPCMFVALVPLGVAVLGGLYALHTKSASHKSVYIVLHV